MASITVMPCQEMVAPDAAGLVLLKAYLDSIGYTVGVTALATRTDTDATFTVKIEYPEWTLEV